jgi:hypothetical protein
MTRTRRVGQGGGAATLVLVLVTVGMLASPGMPGAGVPARPAWAGEGFGMLTQLSARMTRVSPPAVALPGNRIAIRASAVELANAGLARRLAAQLASELFDRDQRLITDSQFPEVVVDVKVLQNRGGGRWEQRQGVEVRQAGTDPRGKPAMGPVTTSAGYRVVTHAVRVSYTVTGVAHGGTLDGDTLAVDFEQAFREGEGAPGEEQVESAALADLSRRIAGRLAPSRDVVEVLLPRGSLETLAPLAAAGLWSRYFDAVEKRPPHADAVAESYRQYALGAACEALGYAAETTPAALRYLERADAYYRAALDANPREKCFSQPYRGLLSTRTFAPPLDRVRASLLAFRRLKSQADALAAARLSPLPAAQLSTPAALLSAAPGAAAPPRSASAAAGAGGAGGEPPMDNATVIRLVQAGLGPDVVLQAIDLAPRCAFDVSVEGLIALSEARVDAAIIRRMQAIAAAKVPRPPHPQRPQLPQLPQDTQRAANPPPAPAPAAPPR